MSLIPRNFYLDEDVWDGFHPVPRIEPMKCDVYEKDGRYHVEMDVPGYDKSDISIICDDGLLTVTAEKKYEHNEENNDKKYIRRERRYGKVSRSFTFNDINEDAISADFRDGVLRIVIPKKEKVETKKVIEIN